MTLKKYGLGVADWEKMLRKQRFVCAVCREVPESGALQIDHEHVRGFIRMTAAEKRKYVRGLLCPFCNHYVVGRHKTPDKLEAAAKYLKAYLRRRG